MTRMEAEADQLGADGIVGVRLEIEFKEFGSDLAEFIAVGTAVKADHPDARGRRLAQQPQPAVHLRPVRPGLLDADPGRLRAAGHGDGHLRLPRRPPAVLAGDGQHRPERRAAAVHRGPLRRPRAGDEPDAGRGRAARTPRASSGCSCSRTATAGAATPPSSSRSARRCARCAPTTTSRPRSSCCRSRIGEHRPDDPRTG